LRHKPEKFTSFDSPRVRLVIRRLIDVMNQKNVNKFMLTKLLYLEIEKYVNDNGSRLLTINYWADVKDYQLGRDGLGVAFFPKKEGLYLPFPDEFHPNKEGTSAMVEIFLKTYSDLFINNTLLQKSM